MHIFVKLKYTKHIASSYCDHPKLPIVPSAFVFVFVGPTLVLSLSLLMLGVLFCLLYAFLCACRHRASFK
jgi:hypothetical protein